MIRGLQSVYQRLTQHTYPLIWLIIGLLGLISFYIRINVIFLANPDVGGIESNVVYSILRLLAGYPLYQNPEQAPYPITQYSPIYYYLTGNVARLIGLKPDDVYEVYAVGRFVSLIANFVYTWGIVKLGRRLQLPTPVAILAAVLAFVLLPPQSYGRPDSLYNAGVIWTLWALLWWNDLTRDGRSIYGAAITAFLVAFSLFVKQSAICLPVIVIGYLVFVSSQPKRVFSFVGWLLVFLLLMYISFFREEARVVYANLIKGVSNGIDLANFKNNLVDHYLRPFAWLVVPGLVISVRYLLFDQDDRQALGLATVGIFLFALTTGLKWGSALNYFTEFTGLAGLLITDRLWQLRHIRSDWTDAGRFGLILGTALVVPINAMNFNWGRVISSPIDLTLYRQEQAVAQYVSNLVQKCPDCLIYSTQFNSSYLNALLFQHCIVPQQDMVIGSAYPRQTFDYTDLDRTAREGKIQFVITRTGETNAPLLPIQLAAYQPIKSLEGYTIYKFNVASSHLTQPSK